MKKQSFLTPIGRIIFWLCFALGNIALFGFVFTKNHEFAFFGYTLLLFATPVNLLFLLGFLLYGWLGDRSSWKDAKTACLYLIINIPIAALYTWIGLEII